MMMISDEDDDDGDDSDDDDDDDDDDPNSCGCIITEFDQKLVLLPLCLFLKTFINMSREGIDLSS